MPVLAVLNVLEDNTVSPLSYSYVTIYHMGTIWQVNVSRPHLY